MLTREDHLFGLLAVQTGLVDVVDFLDAWDSLDEGPLPDLLVQRGLILPEDREHLTYLARRRLPSDEPTPVTAATVVPVAHTERYRILDLCGSGGIGDVWRAHDRRLDREVAIKELKRSRADNEAIRSRFLREARVTCQLDHPGIVPVYDVLPDHDGRPRYAMRLLRGRTLADAIRRLHQRRGDGDDVSLERAELLQAFVAVCNTIGYAHSRGVLHRDLKPANVQLGDYGEVVVLDWGLAGIVRNGQAPAEPPSDGATMPGQFFGTPEYASPEQAAGDVEHVDQRSDVYGLGAILYHLLTGSPPFHGESLSQTLALVRECEPTPVRQRCPEVPAGLEAICHKALSKRPQERYATATDLAAAVLQWQENERLAAERALRESEGRYRLLTETMPQVVWSMTPEWKLEYLNRHGLELLNRGLEDFVGEAWHQVIHPEDLPVCQRHLAHSQATGESVEFEFRASNSAGEYRWFLCRNAPARDDEGRIVGWLGTNTDVDRMKQAERQRDEALEQLRASEERFRTLIQAVPQSLWVARPDGNIEYTNNQAGRAGRARTLEEVGGLGWRQFIHPDDFPAHQRAWEQAQLSGGPFELEYRWRTPDGSYRWNRNRALPLRDADGRIVQWFGCTTDVHDLKQALQQRDEALARLRVLEANALLDRPVEPA